jgi:hypothetical protein
MGTMNHMSKTDGKDLTLPHICEIAENFPQQSVEGNMTMCAVITL